MGAGAFLKSDLFSFQLSNVMNRAALRHQNHFRFGLGRFRTDIHQIGARRLRKDRRNVASAADIDAANVQRLQHLRTGREFYPRDMGLWVALLQQLMAFRQHHADAAFLIANAQGVRRRRGGVAQGGKEQQSAEGQSAERIKHVPPRAETLMTARGCWGGAVPARRSRGLHRGAAAGLG